MLPLSTVLKTESKALSMVYGASSKDMDKVLVPKLETQENRVLVNWRSSDAFRSYMHDSWSQYSTSDHHVQLLTKYYKTFLDGTHTEKNQKHIQISV